MMSEVKVGSVLNRQDHILCLGSLYYTPLMGIDDVFAGDAL